MTSINNNSNNLIAMSDTNNEMTLLRLHLRTIEQAKRTSTAVSSPSPVKPPEGSISSQGLGSNIPLLLQRRRQYREQGGGSGANTYPRLLRTDLIKLVDEALSISTEITMVVPLEPPASAVVDSSGNQEGSTETHEKSNSSARRS